MMHYDPERTYTVPKRFGMKSALIVMTVVALLFALSERALLPATFVVFYGVFLGLLCFGQMAFQSVPRFVSVLVGALYVPAAVYGSEFLPIGSEELMTQVLPRLRVENPLYWLAAIGGFLGYLGGTLLAGMFLVAHQIAGDSSAIDPPNAPPVESPHWQASPAVESTPLDSKLDSDLRA